MMVEESLESPLMGSGVCGGRGLLLKQKPSAVEFESWFGCVFFFFFFFKFLKNTLENLKYQNNNNKKTPHVQLAEKMGLI